jgi:cob(I)alamin adenosyltransferase
MSESARPPRPGKVLLLTGPGKGKTSAALGQVLRMAGHGMSVLVVQFVKGAREAGEHRALKRLADLVTVKPLGKGWLDLKAQPRRAEDLKQVRDAWVETQRLVRGGDFDALVLDEVLFVVSAGFLPAGEVAAFLDSRPEGLTVVLTGRGEVPELIERADYVTVMQSVKHPFDKGGEALAGVEY